MVVTENYAANLPPLSISLLKEWRQAGRTELTSRVRFSRNQAIFRSTPFRVDELRVWRSTMQPQARAFVAGARDDTVDLLSRFFRPFSALNYISLSGDRLLVSQPRAHATSVALTDEAFVKMFSNRAPGQTTAFAAHLLGSLKAVLRNIPWAAALELDSVLESPYLTGRDFTHTRHRDGFPNLILQYTNPGTPYIFTDRTGEFYFRTIAADVSVHGPRVEHGNANVRPDRGLKTRTGLAFQVITK